MTTRHKINGNRTRATSLFGVILDEIVNEKGVSLKEVADRGGMDHTVISRWRLDARTPELRTLKSLMVGLFPITDDERDLLYVVAGYMPPSWKLPTARNLLQEAGYDPNVLDQFKAGPAHD